MEEKRKQFTFYRSFWESVQVLPKKDRLPILEAIISYALDGGEPKGLSQSQSAFFMLVKPNLDASRKKANSGKQGGSKRQANSKQTESKKENEVEKENENEIEVEIEKEKESYISISGGGDGAGACASEADLKSIGLYPWGYPGVLPEIIASTVRHFAEDLMRNSARRSATAQDGRLVFERICRLEDSRWRIDPDAADLLEYAVGQAAIAGKVGNWNYISGILDRLALRDIRTKRQALEYDMTRGEEER